MSYNMYNASQFLSTLSLRRATCYSFRHSAPRWHFYPRSPCGERRITDGSICFDSRISIHALLAESDGLIVHIGGNLFNISIHALLAESDGKLNKLAGLELVFLSTLSLRRATVALN